jgi:hypothetical protein
MGHGRQWLPIRWDHEIRLARLGLGNWTCFSQMKTKPAESVVLSSRADQRFPLSNTYVRIRNAVLRWQRLPMNSISLLRLLRMVRAFYRVGRAYLEYFKGQKCLACLNFVPAMYTLVLVIDSLASEGPRLATGGIKQSMASSHRGVNARWRR